MPLSKAIGLKEKKSASTAHVICPLSTSRERMVHSTLLVEPIRDETPQV